MPILPRNRLPFGTTRSALLGLFVGGLLSLVASLIGGASLGIWAIPIRGSIIGGTIGWVNTPLQSKPRTMTIYFAMYCHYAGPNHRALVHPRVDWGRGAGRQPVSSPFSAGFAMRDWN